MAQKILRIFTIIVIGVASFGLLVGGTSFYQRFIYSNPLEKALMKMEEIEVLQFEQNKNSLFLAVQFNVPERLQPNFYLLLEQLQGQKKNKLDHCVLEIKNTLNNKELVNFFKAAKIPLYEAINTGHFIALSEQLTALSQKDKITYDLKMDNQFIFITAHKGEDFAHLVINRNSGELPLQIITTMGEEYL
jgi:hypothetical protein